LRLRVGRLPRTLRWLEQAERVTVVLRQLFVQAVMASRAGRRLGMAIETQRPGTAVRLSSD
jgi:hypothetical protein